MIVYCLFGLRIPKNIMMAEAGRRMSAICGILKKILPRWPRCHWDIIYYAFPICGSERLIAPPPSEILYSAFNFQNYKLGFPAAMNMIFTGHHCISLIIKTPFFGIKMLPSTVSVTGLADVIQYSYTWTLNLVNITAAGAKAISRQQGGLLMP